MPNSLPLSRFIRFERVEILNIDGRLAKVAGQTGTIIWCDPPHTDMPGSGHEWVYVVHLPGIKCCRSFLESSLKSLGAFDREGDHLGIQAEISFDLVMEDDMEFVEGTYRLPGRFWEDFAFYREKGVSSIQCRKGKYRSAITGVGFSVPEASTLNRDVVLAAMSATFGQSHWQVVKGPDSIVLR